MDQIKCIIYMFLLDILLKLININNESIKIIIVIITRPSFIFSLSSLNTYCLWTRPSVEISRGPSICLRLAFNLGCTDRCQQLNGFDFTSSSYSSSFFRMQLRYPMISHLLGCSSSGCYFKSQYMQERPRQGHIFAEGSGSWRSPVAPMV